MIDSLSKTRFRSVSKDLGNFVEIGSSSVTKFVIDKLALENLYRDVITSTDAVL